MRYKVFKKQHIDSQRLIKEPFIVLQEVWMNDQKKIDESLKIDIEKKDIPFMIT